MRTSVVLLSVLLIPVNAAAQTPLSTLAPPPLPIYGPKTVLPSHLACTDVPVTTHQTPPLQILAPYGADHRELSTRDAIVVLNAGTPQGLSVGQRFFTRRLLPPRNGARVSAEEPGAVHTSGWLTVIAADEHSALARIDYACDAIRVGDYLDAYVEATLPAEVAPASDATDFTNLGRVLQGVDRHEAFGAGDFLSIDRGVAQGLASGARVAFYRDRGDGTPLVEIGTGIVMEVAADTAKVVVDRSTAEVRAGDYFGMRR